MKTVRIGPPGFHPKKVQVRELSTGRQIVRAWLKMTGRPPVDADRWQLQRMMPNGTNRVVGLDEIPDGEDFEVIWGLDNA